MSRNTSRRLSDLDDEPGPFDIRRLIGPNVLKSLSSEALGELVRVLLMVGAMLVALVVWEGGGWVARRTAGVMTGVDRIARGCGELVVHGRSAPSAIVQAQVGPHTRDMIAVFGLLGGLFGSLGGVAGGVMARSLPRAAKAGAAGFGLGAVACGGFCLLVVPIYIGLVVRTPDARIAIASHAVIDSAAAASCALAFGLAARAGGAGSLRLMAAGVMGASLGALMFGVAEMSFFPFESELAPIPRSSLCRLVEYLCATLAPAVCIAAVIQAPPAATADGEEATA